MEGGCAEPLLPADMKGNRPPLPPLRLPSLPDEPRPPVGVAPLSLSGSQPTNISGEQRSLKSSDTSLSDTVFAIDATTTARRLAGLCEFVGQGGMRDEPMTVLPGMGEISPHSAQVDRGDAAQLVARAKEHAAALCRHGDRVRALQLARRAVLAVHALHELPNAIRTAELCEAVTALEVAAAADRARWFAIQNVGAAHEVLSSNSMTDLGLSSLQHTSATARAQCASLLQDAAALLHARLIAELRRQAHSTCDAVTQDLTVLVDRFNAVLLPMVAPDGTRRVMPINAEEQLAVAATVCLSSAQIVAAAMTSVGAVGLGAQQLGGYRGPGAAAALRCDAEALFSDYLYAISAELAPPRPPIGPSGIPPSGAAPLPSSFEAPVPWHLSKVGSGVVGILHGLSVQCTAVEAAAPGVELAVATVMQIAEIAGVAVCLFQSWAAQVFQRERCSLLELCTLHSDSLAVRNALASLRSRPLLATSRRGSVSTGVGAMATSSTSHAVAGEVNDADALNAAIARLAALQQAIGNHLSDGLEESAASFWELLPDKYWSPSSQKYDDSRRMDTPDAASGLVQPSGGSGQADAPTGEYMRRLVEELLAPGAKTLLKLDPVTAQELLPRIVGGSLDSLAAHLLKKRPRFNEAGARRLRMDVAYLESWVRRKLGGAGGDGIGTSQQEATAGAATGLAATLVALPAVQRLRGAAELLADPEDRAARAQLSAADAQAWLALRKWRPRVGCASAIC
jgi:hypothetical protein